MSPIHRGFVACLLLLMVLFAMPLSATKAQSIELPPPPRPILVRERDYVTHGWTDAVQVYAPTTVAAVYYPAPSTNLKHIKVEFIIPNWYSFGDLRVGYDNYRDAKQRYPLIGWGTWAHNPFYLETHDNDTLSRTTVKHVTVNGVGHTKVLIKLTVNSLFRSGFGNYLFPANISLFVQQLRNSFYLYRRSPGVPLTMGQLPFPALPNNEDE